MLKSCCNHTMLWSATTFVHFYSALPWVDLAHQARSVPIVVGLLLPPVAPHVFEGLHLLVVVLLHHSWTHCQGSLLVAILIGDGSLSPGTAAPTIVSAPQVLSLSSRSTVLGGALDAVVGRIRMVII